MAKPDPLEVRIDLEFDWDPREESQDDARERILAEVERAIDEELRRVESEGKRDD